MDRSTIKIPTGVTNPVGISTMMEKGQHKQAVVQVGRKWESAFFPAFGDANGGVETLMFFSTGVEKTDPKVIPIPEGCLGVIFEAVYTLYTAPETYYDVVSHAYTLNAMLLADAGDVLLPSTILQFNGAITRKNYLVAFKNNDGNVLGYNNSFYTPMDGCPLIFPTLGHKYIRPFVSYESNLSKSYESFGFKVHFLDKHVGTSCPCDFKPASKLFKAEY